jgi:plastocyanin
MPRPIRLIGIVSVVVFTTLFGYLPADSSPRPAATANVSIVDFQFDPQTIIVNVGDTVTWQHNGQSTHTVTADDGSFDSGPMNPTQTFSHTFTTIGIFPYYCQFHGAKGGVGMAGRVVVQGQFKLDLPLIVK